MARWGQVESRTAGVKSETAVCGPTACYQNKIKVDVGGSGPGRRNTSKSLPLPLLGILGGIVSGNPLELVVR